MGTVIVTLTREQQDKALTDFARTLADDGKLRSEEAGLLIQASGLIFARRRPTLHLRTPGAKITAKTALEIICHEAIVQEAYKDSVGVWTWGVGVTNASGHIVFPRYKDKPQPISKCLEVYLWLLEEKYKPAVDKAFAGHNLTEAQFTAALSFHYNTGGILQADWVKLWKAGEIAQAKRAFMNWRKPPEIIPRREKERDLFFDGNWCADGRVNVYPVRKPSYTPDWKNVRKVDVTAEIKELLG